MRQIEQWPPKGAKQLSSQIAYNPTDKILFLRKYKYIQNKIKIQNIVSIIVEGHDIYVSHRERKKAMFEAEFYTDTNIVIKNGTLKSIEKILARDGFLRISRNTIIRTAKVAKGNSKKRLV